MKRTLIPLLLLLTFLSGCNIPEVEVKPQVTIVVSQLNPPPTCQLAPNETISISPKGILPEGARISWRVYGGGSIADTSSITTVYTAPAQPSEKPVEIIATIFSAGNEIVEVVQACMIVADPNAAPGSTPEGTPVGASAPATAVANTAATAPANAPADAAATSAPARTEAPQPAASQGQAVPAGLGMVAITEVMGNPCGKQNEEKANEYIELYNYGDQAVDLGAVYLMASNQQEYDPPDTLVAWKTRNTALPNGFSSLVTDTTVLQPKQYALIMEPNYHLLESADLMPYKIPAGTLILTLATKDRLGNSIGGLLTSGSGSIRRDSIYLFNGTPKRVEQILATYAVKAAGPYPFSVTAPYQLPLDTAECQSVQRVTVPGEDKFENWVAGDATPGS